MTLFQNGGAATGMAFNVDDLNELKGLIYGNGNIFTDVEKKLSFAGYDSTLDVLEKMATMPAMPVLEEMSSMPDHYLGLPIGRVKIKQTDSGVKFSLADRNNKEIELGLCFDQTRSIEYLNNILEKDPNAFGHFTSITGMDMEEAADYICTCVNSDDLNFMTELLSTDGNYDFIREFVIPSTLSSGCAFKFAEYTNEILEESFKKYDDIEYKQEYVNIINAIFENQTYEDCKLIGFEAREKYMTLLDLINIYSSADADMKNRQAWILADYQVKKDIGLIVDDHKDVNKDELERILAITNMNATVWAQLKKYHDNAGVSEETIIFTVDKNKKWDEHGFILNISSKEEIEFECIDGIEAITSGISDYYTDSYDEMIREKEKLPERLAMDAAVALLNVACPEAGIPVALLTSAARSGKGMVDNTGKMIVMFSDSKKYKGAVSTGVAFAKDAVDYYKMDDNLAKQRQEMDDFALFLFGASKTGNGVQVVEYANMYELLRMNYIGVNECYQLNLPEQSFFGVRESVKSACSGGTEKGKQEFTDEEITNALLLIMYGEEGVGNRTLINSNDTGERVEWSESFEYKNIFEIPLTLRYQCYSRIQTYNQFDSDGKVIPSEERKYIWDEFEKAVGNY